MIELIEQPRHRGPASPTEHLAWHERHRSLFETVTRTLEDHSAGTGDASQEFARYCIAADLWDWMRTNLGAPRDCDWDEDCQVTEVGWVA